jgi:hypothetical protein
VKDISFGEPQLPARLPAVHTPRTLRNSFCSFDTMEPYGNVYLDLSGAYSYDANSKKITFELKLNYLKPNNKPPIQKIVLGFSEDDAWGDDMVISCDTHPHISAFGHYKVKVFSVKISIFAQN